MDQLTPKEEIIQLRKLHEKPAGNLLAIMLPLLGILQCSRVQSDAPHLLNESKIRHLLPLKNY